MPHQGVFLWWGTFPLLCIHSLSILPFFQEDVPLAVLDMFIPGLWHVHSSPAQSLSFLQRTLISGTLSRAGQSSGDRRSQLFKYCFHSSSKQIILSFLFQSHEIKTLGKGDKGKYLAFFCCYCFFTWFWKHGHVVIPSMKYTPQYPVSCWSHPIVLSASQLLLIAIPCLLWDCTPTSWGIV